MTHDHDQPAWPPGSSDMAARVRAFDWRATPLGAASTWSSEQRAAVAFVLDNRFPCALVWGPSLVTIYNDGFRPILGEKPEALGRSFAEIWSEVWEEIRPIAERAFAGESTFVEDIELTVMRRGSPEQAWFTFSYSPVRAADGTVVGMIDTVVETTEAVRSRRALAESEQRYRAFTSATADVVYRMSPDWSQMWQLDGQGFLADTDEASKDWRDRYILPVARDDVEAAIRHAIRDRTMFELEHPVMRADGSTGWTLSRAIPILDDSGDVVEWLGAASDITNRVMAERALAASEERQAFLLELSDRLRSADREQEALSAAVALCGPRLGAALAQFCLVQADGDSFQVGAEYNDGRMQGLDRTGHLSNRDPAWSVKLGSGEPVFIDDYGDRLPGEHVSRTAETGWSAAVPLVRDGRLVAIFSTASPQRRCWNDAEKLLHREVAERTWTAVEQFRSEAALRESEERLRLIVENAEDYAIFTTDPDGLIVDWRRGAESVFGYTASEVVGKSFGFLFVPEDREVGQPDRERAMAAAHGKASDVRWHLRKNGSRVFIDGVSTALRGRDNALIGFLKIGQDVTERRAGEERQKLLHSELQHRVRNVLATIRSVARRTSETADGVGDYWRHLEGRITAMARTQGLLTRRVGAGVDLQDLVMDELNAHAPQADQLRITGPDVSLPPKPAEVLGLVIHELATNSVKYGALAREHGRIDIRWALLKAEGDPRLSFIWSESGVNVTEQPVRYGFGTELITERVPYELQGVGTMEFGSNGMVATIEFPLTDAPSILQTDASLAGDLQ